jgi:hypothetical protein
VAHVRQGVPAGVLDVHERLLSLVGLRIENGVSGRRAGRHLPDPVLQERVEVAHDPGPVGFDRHLRGPLTLLAQLSGARAQLAHRGVTGPKQPP